MDFEYDPAKSHSNHQKHGIDFEEAQALWEDPWRLDVPVMTEGEARILSVGRIKAKHWTAIWTERNGKVRIISVRRSRRDEVGHYENF